MCIKHQQYVISPNGERRLRETYYARCSPPCPRPQVFHIADEVIPAMVMDPFIGGVQDAPIIRPGPAQQGPVIVKHTTKKEGRKDVRLEFDIHIPGTSRKPKASKTQTTYHVLQQPLQPAGFAPITPPYTPVPVAVHQIQPAQVRIPSPEVVFEDIVPRTPVRQHERPRPPRAPVAPTRRESSLERNARRREEEHRLLAEQIAAIDARMEGLIAEQSARRIAREEAHRTRANNQRIREIDAEITRLQEQLDREQRLRRRAQGNVLHQENNPRAHRPSHEVEDRDHARENHHRRSGFRSARQDAGGGDAHDSEPGLAGRQHQHTGIGVRETRSARQQRTRDRDREIRDLETKVNEGERSRRRRRETLPTSVSSAAANLGLGVNGTAPFFDPFRRVTRARSALRTVRVENRNGVGRH